MLKNLIKSLPTTLYKGKKYKFLFPDNYFYYNCEKCLINCCSRNDKILLHKDFKSNYSKNFKCRKILHNFGPCPELDIDGCCKIEKNLNKQSKPDICNIFPYDILGMWEDFYLVGLYLCDCSLGLKGNISISKDNFFKQTDSIEWDFYKKNVKLDFLLTKQIIQKESFIKILTKDLNFEIIEKYWQYWNIYYQTNYPIPKNNFFIEGLEQIISVELDDYMFLKPLEKLALVFFITLYQDIAKIEIYIYHIIKILKASKKVIKLLSNFDKINCIKPPIDSNSEYISDLISFYHLNKKKSVFESLMKLNIEEKGSFVMEISRFI